MERNIKTLTPKQREAYARLQTNAGKYETDPFTGYLGGIPCTGTTSYTGENTAVLFSLQSKGFISAKAIHLGGCVVDLVVN